MIVIPTVTQTLNLIPDVFTPTQLIESATHLLNLIRLGLVSIQLNLIHFVQKIFFGPVLVQKLSIFIDLEIGNYEIWRIRAIFMGAIFLMPKNPIFIIIFRQVFNPG